VTIVVLDPGLGPLPPYDEWLSDHDDVVLFTGAEADTRSTRYAEVVRFADYDGTGLVEARAVALAPSAIVATGHEDLLRAGALRAYLRLPGLHRAHALARADLLEQRQILDEIGTPTVPCAPLRRAGDLYWHARRWRGPIRVRSRRAEGWPTVEVLRDDNAIAAFAETVFADGFDTLPSLLVEPDRGTSRVITPARDQAPAIVVDAAAVFPVDAGCEHIVTVHDTDGGPLLVDSVAVRPVDEEGRRLLVLAQAEVPARRREQVG
jgi:hypothetical protein